MSEPTFHLAQGDALALMKALPPRSVDAIVTDPPYGVDLAGWDTAKAMRSNPPAWTRHPNPKMRTAKAYEHFCGRLAQEALRVLRPGGFVVAFSANMTYHRMAVAFENTGFEIRDMVEWVYIMSKLRNSGVLMCNHDPAMLARAPGRGPALRARAESVRAGTWPTNVIPVPKPSITERRLEDIDHPSPKPVELMRWLIRLTTDPGDVVLEPFLGSGATLLAAAAEGRSCIGFDLDPQWVALSQRRLDAQRARSYSPIDGTEV